jgi:carbon storage regulator
MVQRPRDGADSPPRWRPTDSPAPGRDIDRWRELAVLVLTRKVGERIHIGDSVVVTVVRVQNDKVRIGIEAPPHIAVHREEVLRRSTGAVEPARGRPARREP